MGQLSVCRLVGDGDLDAQYLIIDEVAVSGSRSPQPDDRSSWVAATIAFRLLDKRKRGRSDFSIAAAASSM